ncbi:MAG: [FeFe] hydrogenase H-cluster radical SAM maturase HydE [Ruthenibacterium sp.]
MTNREIIDALHERQTLSFDAWVQLIRTRTEDDCAYAAQLARTLAQQHFGKQIYFRGVIEFTNYCKNDCYYCGIRHGNTCAARYRLTQDDILACCEDGYAHGFRTFVLQGGEDPYFTDERLVAMVSAIRARFADCAITLSVGERSRASYQRLFDAGANRYLLRHETADAAHYAQLHPADMLWAHRMQCLRDLKGIGYQTGCGFMVGTPHQTAEHLAADMVFIGAFRPQMIGAGPFIPHRDTPFRDAPAGSVALSLFLLSLCRIAQPEVLLPATTALGTVCGDGRQLGVLAGCNVVMPNLSPLSVRKKYMLYNDKVGTDDSAADGVRALTQQMEAIGYTVHVGRGDYKKEDMPHD